MQTSADKIIALLAAHKIKASIRSSAQGLRVDRYTLAVEPKIRVRRLQLLEPDLTAALGLPVRVSLGTAVQIDVAHGRPFQPVPFEPLGPGLGHGLTFPLGLGQDGHTSFLSLAEAPHLLIAGSTGGGKSVCEANALACLAWNNPPEALQIALIDTKRVEMGRWKALPHLCAPVATDTESATRLLEALIGEMGRRYELLEANSMAVMPGLLLVIDELADLMLEDEKAARNICRLAQLGRGAGIHLILATQRPDSKVVTGILKANMPARIALYLPSVTDSRVILDSPGAEKLLGAGDMLLRIPGAPLERIQGALVTPDDIARAIARWPGKAPQIETVKPTVPNVGSLWRARQAQLLEERNGLR